MRKLLMTTALVLALATGSVAAQAEEGHHGKWKAHMEETLAKLPADKQALVKASFEQGKEANKASREQMKTLHQEITAIMKAPTFDKAAFLAKHKELDSLKNAQSQARAERMAELAGKLTAQERQVLADGFGKRFEKGDTGTNM